MFSPVVQEIPHGTWTQEAPADEPTEDEDPEATAPDESGT